MSTIKKKFYEYGYCEKIKNNRYIEIGYISIPQFCDEPQEFCKTSNRCIDIKEAKCNKGEKCEIFKKANEIKLASDWLLISN